MKKFALLISLLPLLTGCPYPARTVMPLETQVVDAGTGTPIGGASVLRIVCDIHDRKCTNGQLEKSETDKDGKIKLKGKRQWGLWFPAPGGLPAPNHQIAIWKPGYQAFAFSQYGDINDLLSWTDREDLKKAIQEVPKERKNLTPNDNPENMFENGKVKLQRLTHNPPLEPSR